MDFPKRINDDTFQPEIQIAGAWIPLELVVDAKADLSERNMLFMLEERYGKEVRDAVELELTLSGEK